MASHDSFWTRLLRIAGALLAALVAKNASGPRRHTRAAGSSSSGGDSGPERTQGVGDALPGEDGPTQTRELDPRSIRNLQIVYGPVRNGLPDGGEVIWTWVPYEEADGRGKDRPVLVIGRQNDDRVYAVKMTSKSHSGPTELIPVGSGAWDSQGRPSYVDVDQLYSVHRDGARREASELARNKFDTVANKLRSLYGWR